MEAKQSEADRRRAGVLREGYEIEAALQAGIGAAVCRVVSAR